jgi:hypothetical protein
LGRLPVACGAVVAAELPVPEAPALPEPDDDPLELEPEPEVCGLGDSGSMVPLGVVWALEPLDPLDPLDPDPPDPEPPNGSWYC